jgi:hypothetical protein
MADHGRSWFIGAIFVMSVATYTLAVYIGNFLDFFRWPPRRLGGGGKKGPPEDPPNVWRLLWQSGETVFNWLGHTDKGNRDSSPPSTDDGKPEEKGQGSQNEQRSMEEGKAICLSNGTSLGKEQTSKKPGFRLSWPRKPES